MNVLRCTALQIMAFGFLHHAVLWGFLRRFGTTCSLRLKVD